jgi:hypothetical protein
MSANEDLRSQRDVAESLFSGTRFGRGRIEAIGAEVMENANGRIRDYQTGQTGQPDTQPHDAAAGLFLWWCLWSRDSETPD